MAKAELATLAKFFQERRAILWVCQAYDLVPGQRPHANDLAETEAALRYRTTSEESDTVLAKLYWEAVWLEGARSPLLESLRKQQREDPSARRKVVLLASEADAKANVNSSEFLPVFALAGLIDDNSGIPATSRYDPTRRRTRDRIAWDLSSKLVEFPQRLLVVVGMQNEGSLTNLFEVLSEKQILDLTILLVLPEGVAEPPQPTNPAIRVISWTGIISHFAELLTEIEAPKAGELPEWGIRVAKKTLRLSDRDVARIREHFSVLTERMLIPPNQFTLEDLHAFFLGNLENWQAYANSVGLPVERAYRTESNQTLAETVVAHLRKAHSETELASFFWFRDVCNG